MFMPGLKSYASTVTPMRQADPPPGKPRRLWFLARELVYLVIFALVYEEIREHMVQAGSAATRHALSIVSAERALGIFDERVLQGAFIKIDPIVDTFNVYYGATHFLVPAALLIWLIWRHPARYVRARTALVLITALGFVVFWLFPVAPPRLLPHHFGIVDTLAAGKSGHIEASLINAAGDKYASMPSLHVAWAVWCAVAFYPVARHLVLRILALAYPVATTLVVVATGNHFYLDAIAGVLLAVLTWAAVTHASRCPFIRAAGRIGEHRWRIGPSGHRPPSRRTGAGTRMPPVAHTRRTWPRCRPEPSTSNSTSGEPRTHGSSPSTTRPSPRASRSPRSATPSCA